MTYQAFDQSPEGWRQLIDCPAQATLVLKQYLKRLDFETRGVRWHLAQVLAGSGDYKPAIEAAMLTLNPPEIEQGATFSWNSYVLATVAFLQNDRAAFDTQLEAQRRAAEAHPANRINLDVLMRMSRCFDRPYREAYGCNAAP